MNKDAVTSLIEEVVQSWNAHDMKRFAACFAEDADFVNVAGQWIRGRDEIERVHAVLHNGAFSDSTLDLNVASVREVAPGVAVTHVKWRMVGHKVGGPQRTSGPRNGVQSMLIRDRDGKLEIVASHNTDTIER